jgi:hypothetical protein
MFLSNNIYFPLPVIIPPVPPTHVSSGSGTGGPFEVVVMWDSASLCSEMNYLCAVFLEAGCLVTHKPHSSTIPSFFFSKIRNFNALLYADSEHNKTRQFHSEL